MGVPAAPFAFTFSRRSPPHRPSALGSCIPVIPTFYVISFREIASHGAILLSFPLPVTPVIVSLSPWFLDTMISPPFPLPFIPRSPPFLHRLLFSAFLFTLSITSMKCSQLFFSTGPRHIRPSRPKAPLFPELYLFLGQTRRSVASIPPPPSEPSSIAFSSLEDSPKAVLFLTEKIFPPSPNM